MPKLYILFNANILNAFSVTILCFMRQSNKDTSKWVFYEGLKSFPSGKQMKITIKAIHSILYKLKILYYFFKVEILNFIYFYKHKSLYFQALIPNKTYKHNTITTKIHQIISLTHKNNYIIPSHQTIYGILFVYRQSHIYI